MSLRSAIPRLARGVGYLLYPPACLICQRADVSAGSPHSLCTDCLDAVRTDTRPTCPRCAGTVGPHADVAEGCARCRATPFRFEGVIRLGAYEGRLRGAILAMKRPDGEPLAETVGAIFAEVRGQKLLSRGADVVTPVPLYWVRKWERGYNQSEAVARVLSLALGIRFAGRLVLRTRNTPPQTTLTPTARRENLRGAFRVPRGTGLSGLRVLLVDDVLTTGSTADEAARVLRAAGAAQVSVAVVAHR